MKTVDIYRGDITSVNPKGTDYLLIEVRSPYLLIWNNKVSSESFYTSLEDFVIFLFLESLINLKKCKFSSLKVDKEKFRRWVLSKGFHAGVRAIGYSHGLIPANESVQHFIKCQPLGTFVVCFYASLWLQLFTRICTDLDWTTDLKYATRLGQTSLVLRAPVRKNRTYLGMGGQFDFIFLWKNARL